MTQPAAPPGHREVKELRYQGWADTVTFPELAEDLGYLGDVKLNWVGNTISGPQDIQSAATGQTDFGGAFNGAVVKLVAAGAPIKAVISYYGEDEKTLHRLLRHGGQPDPGRPRPDRQEDRREHPGRPPGGRAQHLPEEDGLTPEEIKQVELVVVPPVNTEQALRQRPDRRGALGGILRDKALAAGGLRSAVQRLRPVRRLRRRPVRAARATSSSRTRTPSRSSSRAWPRPSSGSAPRPRGGHRPVDEDHRQARAQRGHRRPQVLEERRRRRQGRRIKRPGLHPLVDWLDDAGDVKPAQVKRRGSTPTSSTAVDGGHMARGARTDAEDPASERRRRSSPSGQQGPAGVGHRPDGAGRHHPRRRRRGVPHPGRARAAAASPPSSTCSAG